MLRVGRATRVPLAIQPMPDPHLFAMPPPLPMKPRRSFFVGLLGWLMMIAGVLGLPISFITALMLILHSYGTANAGLIDSTVVVFGPLCLLLGGLGLLRRWRWAWGATMALLLTIMAIHGKKLAEGPTPTRTYTTPSGVKTTIIGTGKDVFSLPVILVALAVTAKLLSRGVRREFFPDKANSALFAGQASGRTWRVGHFGRDMMYYEEKAGGAWRRIDIDGEMLTGRAHHVIYFASAEAWQAYPEWARGRRDEIVARIKSEFREPDYAYEDGGTAKATPTLPGEMTDAQIRAHFRRDNTATPKQLFTLFVCIILMLGVAGWMGWMVKEGLDRKETSLPLKRPSLRRVVSCDQEPAMYWTAIGIYGSLGVGCGVLGLWGIREAFRLRPKR